MSPGRRQARAGRIGRDAPGETVVTWMPGHSSRSSRRRLLVSAFSACLAALYAERAGTIGNRPSIEDTLTMWPAPRSLKCGSTTCIP